MKRPLGFALALAVLPIVAFAQTAREQPTDRFVLEKSGDGFVRLDRQSGAMSYCTLTDGNLVCRMAADERAAFEDELDRLEKRVTALEKTGAGPKQQALPSDAEVDRSISIMERFMRSFMGLVDEFREKEEKTVPGPPERT
ncbi:hypothetical protein [Allorhizobium borbori]|uniref:Uncharacterized protein n=1 Tax=Allorhizobium borbori TaxID=485907 RepID=A0A7W6JZV1_9HYPH|nr:hypothetical protein [Allorhizobium borbori]MBB4101525.1 hypothetical protein [Allorhizobium borbori]